MDPHADEVSAEHLGDGMTTGPDAAGPVVTGALLRQARERQGRSVEECARLLRARPRQVTALEAGDLTGFGGAVYVRGFLRTYAGILGLDADEVLRRHGEDPAFRGPVLPPRESLRIRRDPPGWLVGLVGVLVVGGVITAVLGLGGRRAPGPVAPVDAALGSASELADDAAVGTPPSARPLPPPVPTPTPAGPPVDVVLTFEAASWLEVLVDDALVEPGLLVPSGETLRFAGRTTVALRFGNAGGVRVELNGDDLGPPGRPGEVIRLRLGPDGVLPPADAPTDRPIPGPDGDGAEDDAEDDAEEGDAGGSDAGGADG